MKSLNMTQILIFSSQFLILQFFNFKALQNYINHSQKIKYWLIFPIVLLSSILIAHFSALLASLVGIIILISINKYLLRAKKWNLISLFPMFALANSLLLYLILSYLLTFWLKNFWLQIFLYTLPFLMGASLSLRLQKQIIPKLKILQPAPQIFHVWLIVYLIVFIILLIINFMQPLATFKLGYFILLELLFILIVLLLVGGLGAYWLISWQRLHQYQNQQYIHQLESYAELLEQNEQQAHQIRHDFNNILTSGLLYLQNHDFRGLEKYFKTALHLNPTFPSEILGIKDLKNVQILAVKGLLSFKIAQAQQQKLQLSFVCSNVFQQASVNEVQLVEILGILIDNALEAIQSDKGKIQIQIIEHQQYWSLVIQNSLVPQQKINLKQIMQPGFTTKSGHQGIGLSSVSQIIEHDSQLELLTKVQAQQIIQEVILKKEVKNGHSDL